MKKMSNLITKLALATTLATAPLAKANYETVQETYTKPQREIELDFANPFDSSEANTKAWYSANKIIGKSFFSNSEDSVLLPAIGIYALFFNQFMSHEGGHDRVWREGGDTKGHFDFTELNGILPNWVHGPNYEYTQEQFEKALVAGPNQNELNMNYLYEKNLDSVLPEDALATILTRGHIIAYNLSSRGTVDRSSEMGDFPLYSKLMKEKGIDYSLDDHLAQVLLTTGLSMNTWDALSSLDKPYGSAKPTKFNISENIKLVPPMVNLYLHPEGQLINTKTAIQFPNKNLYVDIGSDVDGIWGGKLNTLRAGVKLEGINFKNIEISPFAYITQKRSNPLENKGYDIGLEARINLTENIALTGKIELAENEFLENSVKGKDNGFNTVAGIRMKL